MTKFTTPVSMGPITKEQYERDLRDRLMAMGYKEVKIPMKQVSDIYLVNNYYDVLGNIEFTNLKDFFGRYYIETYNPELFLALASMTDLPVGYKDGEWLYNNLTKQLEKTKGNLSFSHCRKATKEEIIQHFEGKPDNSPNTN